jgi:hypothetical protein
MIYKLYDKMYLLTVIGLTPGGSSTVYIYTQTMHKTTQSTQTIHRTTQLTNWEECRSCPVFASYTQAFPLQLAKARKNLSQCRKNLSQGRKTSVRVEKTSAKVGKPQSG